MSDQPDPVGTFTSPRSWRILACDCDWWDHHTEVGSLCLRCDTPILSTRVVPQPEPRPVLLAHVIGRPHWQLAPVREWRGMRLYEADNPEPVATIDEEGHVLGARPDRLPRILFAAVPVMLHLTCGISIAPLADGGEALAALDPATAVRPSRP